MRKQCAAPGMDGKAGGLERQGECQGWQTLVMVGKQGLSNSVIEPPGVDFSAQTPAFGETRLLSDNMIYPNCAVFNLGIGDLPQILLCTQLLCRSLHINALDLVLQNMLHMPHFKLHL